MDWSKRKNLQISNPQRLAALLHLQMKQQLLTFGSLFCAGLFEVVSKMVTMSCLF